MKLKMSKRTIETSKSYRRQYTGAATREDNRWVKRPQMRKSVKLNYQVLGRFPVGISKLKCI